MAPAPCGAAHLAKELSMSPLRRRMIDDMQIRNLTPNTQRVYVAQVARFACYFRKSPDLLGPDGRQAVRRLRQQIPVCRRLICPGAVPRHVESALELVQYRRFRAAPARGHVR